MKRALLLVVVVVGACADPVQSAEQTALGPEDPSVPRGELHRPGQPCLVCHSDFAFAGTVYEEDFVTAFQGATVTLTDTAGDQLPATTNAAGNFIIRKSDLPATFSYPVGTYTDDAGNAVFGITVVGSDPNNPAQMVTQIGRDGSCNACHTPTASASSPGPIYVTTGTP
jgi:hypothetical protein